MTILRTTTEVSYTGDGATVAFPVTFAFFGTTTTAEIEVIERTIATGAEVTKVNVTDYTVSGGNNATGTVTAVSAPANTVEWHIRRATTQTQGTDYVENDAFPAETHEDALDRLTMVAQEQESDLGRTFQFPVTYTGGASTAVPEPSAGKALKWNDAGDALENSDTDPDTAAAAAAASAAAAATSETNAATSETNAATSETNAATSASNASTSETNAGTSETNAAASAAAAAASAAGIYWKEPVVNATTANITLSGEQTIDGVLTSTSRILVKDQTAQEENGVYVTAAGAWSRATPLDTWDEHVGAAVIVSEGTANSDSAWICTVDAGGTLETTAITWAQMSAVYTSATTTSEGIIELATQAEVDAGTDTSRAVTPETLAGMSDIVGPAAVTGSVNAQTGTTYTLVLTDAFKTVTMDNASANTLTIPANSSVAFSTGDRIDIWMKGAGATTVTGDTGVTLNGVSAGGGAISAQYGAVSIVKVATDTWLMTGNHAAVA